MSVTGNIITFTRIKSLLQNIKKGGNKMKKVAIISLAFASAILLGIGSMVYAQSSGNFSANINTTQCLIDNDDGTLQGGITANYLETTIKTPNSQWTALVIRPSLVTGLYTKTKVTETVPTATAWAGVRVRVLIDGKVVAPGTPVGGTGADDGWVFYDKRWQQVNQNFLSVLGNLADDAGIVTDELFLELILSTLSAHSMDFVAGDVGGGEHILRVEWQFEDSDNTGGNSAACVGPGVLTVQQVKTFSTGGGIDILP